MPFNMQDNNRSAPLKLIINDLRIPIEKDGVDTYITALSQKLEIDVEKKSIARVAGFRSKVPRKRDTKDCSAGGTW